MSESVDFVLDASVAIRWALQDGSAADRMYADRVLDSLAQANACVPVLWYTELVHVLRCAEDDARIGEAAISAFLLQLNQLSISADEAAPRALQNSVAAVSRQYGLTGYDAQYLELALRLQVPLATLDKKLRKRAEKAGVGAWSPSGQ